MCRGRLEQRGTGWQRRCKPLLWETLRQAARQLEAWPLLHRVQMRVQPLQSDQYMSGLRTNEEGRDHELVTRPWEACG